MSKSVSRLQQMILFLAMMTLIGCATEQLGYQKAFDSEHSLTQNQCTFQQSADSIFMITKQVLIQQGFTIESAELKSGVIKAVHNMQDKDDPEISYNIQASVDISEIAGPQSTVSLAASQQTILHRARTTWWHLFWIIPLIPTGTEYQTLVIKEGKITTPSFYTNFFNSLKVAVTKHNTALKVAAEKAAEKEAKIKAEAEAKAKAESDRIAAEKEAKIKAESDRIAAEKANAAKLAAEKEAAEIEAALDKKKPKKKSKPRKF